MNPTTRAIFQSVLTSDPTLTLPERAALQRTISGEVEGPTPPGNATNGPLLITQKKAAELLSVSRVTIWRMTKDGLLHPVEILPGTWRYSNQEVFALARNGTLFSPDVRTNSAKRPYTARRIGTKHEQERMAI